MKDTKIVFVDLDGTLKDSNQKISMRNKKVIEKLSSIGIQVVFTSGRSLPYTESLSKQFGASNYIISSNGAEIYNYLNKNIIYSDIISKENIISLGEIIKKHDLFFIANCITKTFTNKLFDDPGKKVVNSIDDIIDEHITQLIVESYDIELMKIFRQELEALPDLKISNKSRNYQDSSKILFYDVTNRNVSKGNAVKTLCNYLNIDLSKTMSIGDSDNDIEMLRESKIKVAMSNSTENLKKEANYITLSNDQDGVAFILERLYDELS